MAKKNTNGSIDFQGYNAPTELSPNRRAADALNWAAEKFPYQYAQWNVLLKAIQGYKRLPRLDSEAVIHLKKSATSIRRHLYTHHARVMDSEPGMGIRALVDDADTLRIAMPKKFRRLSSAKHGAEAVAAMIDLGNVPDTEELHHYKKWMKSDVMGILTTLKKANFDRRALPPVRKEDEEETS